MKRNLPTRRQMIGGVAAGLGILATRSTIQAQTPQTAPAQPDVTRTSLHQQIDLHATPERLYHILLDSKQFAAFTGEPAEIGPDEGSAFSMFSGVIVGRNIELVPDQRIVQAWRPKYWRPGEYSVVRFQFKAQGTRTTIILDHTGFPEGDYTSLYSGWGEKYWGPLEKFLVKTPDAPGKVAP